MASDTSSDIINNFDNISSSETFKKNPIKKETTETDLYLGLVANPSKKLEESVKSSSSLQNNDSTDNLSASSSSSKGKYEKVNISPKKHSHKEHSHKEHSHREHSHKEHSHREHSHKERSHNKKESINNDSSNKSRVSPTTVDNTDKIDLTPQQIKMKKIELLRKLSDIKTKGYKLSKEYDFNSSIEDMEYEYDLLKSFVDRRNGIKLYKNTILNIANIVEFANNKYDPFGIKLEGWSEHMGVEVDSYDDVMEELYEKYKGKGKSIPAEIKLFLLIAASGAAFHFSKAFLSKTPGMEGVMNMQPEIISKIVNNKKPNQFMSEQELNIELQRRELQANDKKIKQDKKQQAMQSTSANFQTYHQPVNFNIPNPSVNFSIPLGTPNHLIQNNDPRNSIPIIKQNESVKAVLQRLHQRDSTLDTAETQDDTTTNNDRLLSDTMSDNKKKKKKNLMVIT